VLRAMHGEVSKTRWTRISYAIFRPLLPLLWAIAPSALISTEELGRAMIRAARQGAPKRVLENVTALQRVDASNHHRTTRTKKFGNLTFEGRGTRDEARGRVAFCLLPTDFSSA
jgi:hypothetical protein